MSLFVIAPRRGLIHSSVFAGGILSRQMMSLPPPVGASLIPLSLSRRSGFYFWIASFFFFSSTLPPTNVPSAFWNDNRVGSYPSYSCDSRSFGIGFSNACQNSGADQMTSYFILYFLKYLNFSLI